MTYPDDSAGYALDPNLEPLALENLTAEGSFATDAEVELDFSCGELAVSTQDGTDWSVVARHGSDEVPDVTSDADSSTSGPRAAG